MIKKIKRIIKQYTPNYKTLDTPIEQARAIQDLYDQVREIYDYINDPDFDENHKGDKGDPGLQGEQGPKGDKGDIGPSGPVGPKGDKGEIGERGPQGIQGQKGDRGERGLQGIKGDKGDTGDAFEVYKEYASVALMNADKNNVPVGKFVLINSNVEDPDNSKLYTRTDNIQEYPTGFKFLTDMSGSQGIVGPKGDKGDKGDTGEQGPIGPQGEQGIKGDTGEKGDKGDKGDQGIQGEKGEQGETGAQGPKGDKGDKGDTGQTGATGATGPQGPKGDTGSKGDKGDKGDAFSYDDMTAAQKQELVQDELPLAMIAMRLAADSRFVKTETTNPEFFNVIVDYTDKIVIGIRRDGTTAGMQLKDAIEFILENE